VTRKVCAEPGCPAITDTTRCTEHTRQRDRARGTRQQRGYGADHDRLRAAWQRELDNGAIIYCWRPDCDRRIDPTAWHLGHDDHDRTIYRGPECVPCNTATAGRVA
jgi:hypothetical protein